MSNFVIEISSLYDLDNYRDFIEDSEQKIIIKNKKNTIYSLGFPYIDLMLKSIAKEYKDNIEIYIDIGDDAAIAAHGVEKGYKSIIFNGDDIIKNKLESIGEIIGNKVNVINEMLANVVFSEDERKIIFLK